MTTREGPRSQIQIKLQNLGSQGGIENPSIDLGFHFAGPMLDAPSWSSRICSPRLHKFGKIHNHAGGIGNTLSGEGLWLRTFRYHFCC